MKLVLFEPDGYADSENGTLSLTAQRRRKLENSSLKNRNFVGEIGFEYEVARLDRSSGVTKTWPE